jgi:glycosyltransferase involved in cell wall biosynthesis
VKTVSIVINTFNRCASLERTLRSLEWLDYENFEVIVVNGPSTDGTEDLLDRLSGLVKRGHCPNRNLSESRNIGIRMASGEIVAFIDDDAYPDPGWLDHLAKAFEWGEVAASGGPVIGHTGFWYQVWHSRADRFGNFWTDFPPCVNPTELLSSPGSREYTYTIGTNSAFRRDILVGLGGFDEEFEYYLDETDLCCRITDAGYVVAALDDGFVYHKFLPSNIRERSDVIRDWYQVLKSRFYFGMKHGVPYSSFAEVCAQEGEFVTKTRANVELNFEAGIHDEETREKFEDDVAAASNLALELYMKGVSRERPPEWFDNGGTPFLQFATRRTDGPKLHLCFLSSEYPPAHVNGIGRVVHVLATSLAQRGHCVRVLTRGEDHVRVDLEDDVWVHRVPVVPHQAPDDVVVPQHVWDYSASLLDELHRLEMFRPVDLVQGPNWDSEGIAVVLEGRYRYLVGMYTPLKTVLKVDAAMRQRAGEAGTLFDDLLDVETIVYQRAHGFLACGPAIVEEISSEYGVNFPAERVGTVPHGLPDDLLIGEHEQRKGHLRLLFVGRLEARKGIDVLLESAVRLAAVGTAFELRIVGDDSLRAPSGGTYREDYERDFPSLSNRVHFLGRIDDETLRAEYAQCDVFVAPSRFESFGLILLEAMMFSKPVVATDIGGMREIVADGVSGLLIPPGDADALMKALQALLGSAELRASLGAGGRAVYEERFTPERMADRAEAFYWEMLRVRLDTAITAS